MNVPLFKQAKSTYTNNNQVSPIKSLGQQEDLTEQGSPQLAKSESNEPLAQKKAMSNPGPLKQSMFKSAQQSARPSAVSLMKQNKKWETIKDMYNAQKFQNMDAIYVNPENPIYQFWKCLVGAAMLYYPIMIPIRNAFELQNSKYIFQDFFLDGLFLVDMILNFITGNQEKGVDVFKIRKISIIYLKTSFIYDAIAIIPWQVMEKNTTSFGFLLFKLFRLRYWDRFTLFLRVIVFSVLMCVHVMNCIWITLGKFNDGKVSWIQTVIPEDGLVEDYLKRIYLNGFYYIVTTIATVGYGDISCQTLYEMLYACFSMFFGIALFAYIQGGLVDAIKTSLLSGEIKEAKHQEEFQTWLIEREQNITHPISSKKLKIMRECIQFKFKYEFSTFIFESEYFQYLPPLDQKKIFIFYFTEFTTLYSTFFRNISDVSITKQIIAAFKPVYIPKDGIVQAYSTKPKGIYFIFKGKVIIQQIIELKDKLDLLSFRELSQGSFIGESCLIDKPSKFNFKVSDDKDLYCFFLKKEKIIKILESAPLVLQQLMKIAHFRNKYFKFEGQKIEEQNNIYTSRNRKSTINLSKKINSTIENAEKSKSQRQSEVKQNDRFLEINKEQQEQGEKKLEEEVVKKDKKKQTKLYLLEQIQLMTEQQNAAIFKDIQQDSVISNLYKQMLPFTQQLQQSKFQASVGPAVLPTSDQQYVKDIFQEQFDERDSQEEIMTKQPFQHQAKSNNLSNIGKESEIQYDTSRDTNLNIGETYQINKIRQQSINSLHQRFHSQLSGKDSLSLNQNFSEHLIPLTQNIKSPSSSSYQGTIFQKSRLSFVKDNEEMQRKKVNSGELNRSNSLYRRNGLLQSQLRENNQQIVHKRSQSETISNFQFSPVNAPIKINDDQMTNMSRQNASNNQQNGNGQFQLFSQVQSPHNNSNLQYLFPLSSDDDNDNINDVKSFQVKSNKKDEFQVTTTNTQILTNPQITLNTEADQQHLISDENSKQKSEDNIFQNKYIMFADQNIDQQNKNSNQRSSLYEQNIVNQLIGSDQVVEQDDYEENQHNRINYFNREESNKGKKFITDMKDDYIVNDKFTLNGGQEENKNHEDKNQIFQIDIDRNDFIQNNNSMNRLPQNQNINNTQNMILRQYMNSNYPNQITEESFLNNQTLNTKQSEAPNEQDQIRFNTIPTEQIFLFETQTNKQETTNQLIQTIQESQNTEREELHYTFPIINNEKEHHHNKPIHIPTEPSDYECMLQTEPNVQSKKNKKTHADRFMKKNYFEDQKRKSINIKKLYQQQLELIINQAEQESVSRLSQGLNSRVASARNSGLNSFNLPLIGLNQLVNQNDQKNIGSGMNSNSSQQNSPNNNILESQDNDKNKKSDTPKSKLGQSRKISREIESPISLDKYQSKPKSLSQYIHLSQSNQKNRNLSNFSALLKIMTLDQKFKKKKESELNELFGNNNKNNLESSMNSIKQTNKSKLLDTQHDNDKLPSLASCLDLQKDEEEIEQTENHLDKSIDIPIEIIEPSFTLEDFGYTLPYLKNQIQRLENRVEEIVDSVRNCSQFCNEKVQKIKSFKERKTTTTNNQSTSQTPKVIKTTFSKVNVQ